MGTCALKEAAHQPVPQTPAWAANVWGVRAGSPQSPSSGPAWMPLIIHYWLHLAQPSCLAWLLQHILTHSHCTPASGLAPDPESWHLAVSTTWEALLPPYPEPAPIPPHTLPLLSHCSVVLLSQCERSLCIPFLLVCWLPAPTREGGAPCENRGPV